MNKLDKNFQVDVSGCTPEEIKEMAEFAAGELGGEEVDHSELYEDGVFCFLKYWEEYNTVYIGVKADNLETVSLEDFRAMMNAKKEASKPNLGHSVLSSPELEKQNEAQKALDEVHCGETVSERIVRRTTEEPVEFVDMDGKGIEEYTGSSVSYYKVKVEKPTTIAESYEAECNDIIEALNMNYAEGNAFKAIWRKCAARLGKSKKGYTDGLYDSEKVVFFGERMVEQEKK